MTELNEPSITRAETLNANYLCFLDSFELMSATLPEPESKAFSEMIRRAFYNAFCEGLQCTILPSSLRQRNSDVGRLRSQKELEFFGGWIRASSVKEKLFNWLLASY